MSFDLPLIWAMLIAIAVLAYVVLDGFDLGLGILFPFAPHDRGRDLMMTSVAPVWDGNETWLVLGGGGLFAAFPLAYAIIMPAVYMPITIMLIALIFRGVAFEFRFKSTRLRPLWDRAFAWGSAIATFAQGVVLGAFIQGFEVSGRDYAGGAFDWATPFSMLTGLALVAGYAMLGCGWLIMKLEGDMQDWAFRLMPRLGLMVLAGIAAVSLWTPLLHGEIAARWFTWPNIAYLSPVPLLVAVASLALVSALRRRHEFMPFILTLVLFVLSYIGLGISLWPAIVPPSITIWQAATAPQSLAFMLVGALALLPVIIGYTVYVYWVFRGKTRLGEGYH